jgi:hypothetical protein
VNRDIDSLAILKDSAISLAGIVLVLCAVEGVLRMPSVAEALPRPLVYYAYDVPRKLLLLERVQERGELDVLFVGSSIVRAAFDPASFDRARSARTGQPSLSFNAGLGSMFPGGTALYLERVWLRYARPRHVLFGVREHELRAMLRVPPAIAKGRIESLWWGKPAYAPLLGDLLQQLHVLHYRGSVYKIVKRVGSGRPLNDVEVGEFVPDARGFRGEPRPLPIMGMRNGRYFWRYKDLGSKNRYRVSMQLMERMHTLCKARGIRFAIVNVPEHPERFGGKNGPRVFKAFHRAVSAWADAHDVPFLDITHGNYKFFSDDKHYSDYHHYTNAGGAAFSQLLAEQFVREIDQR